MLKGLVIPELMLSPSFLLADRSTVEPRGIVGRCGDAESATGSADAEDGIEGASLFQPCSVVRLYRLKIIAKYSNKL